MNDIMVEWQGLTAEEQLAIVRAGVFSKAKEHYGLEVLRQNGNELGDFINETFALILDPDRLAKVEADREQAGKPPVTMVGFVYMMANSAISNLVSRGRKHDNRRADELDPETEGAGNDLESMVIYVDLQRFIRQLDERNRQIVEMLTQGYTEREMGAALNISGPAVHKRITRIRADLRKALA